jgi:hypothetical protein
MRSAPGRAHPREPGDCENPGERPAHSSGGDLRTFAPPQAAHCPGAVSVPSPPIADIRRNPHQETQPFALANDSTVSPTGFPGVGGRETIALPPFAGAGAWLATTSICVTAPTSCLTPRGSTYRTWARSGHRPLGAPETRSATSFEMVALTCGTGSTWRTLPDVRFSPFPWEMPSRRFALNCAARQGPLSCKSGPNAVARPFLHSAGSSAGRLAHLASYKRAQSGANDGSGGPTVLVVVAAAAT